MVMLPAISSSRYERLASVPHDATVVWKLGLKPQDPSQLGKIFDKVSDPTHSDYGRYLNAQQADALTAPSQQDLDAIHNWLGHRRTTFLKASNVLVVQSTAGEIRTLTSSDIAEFVDKSRINPRRILRSSTAILLPAHIKNAITFTNLNSLPMELKPLHAQINQFKSADLITPIKLRKLYNVPELSVSMATQSAPAFYQQNWSPADLTYFEKLHELPSARVVQKGNRVNNPNNATGEVSLDLQYITAMAPNATTTVWTMNGSNPYSADDEPFLEWATQVLDDPSPPLVHSISYADDEDHIMTVAKDYASHLDTLFQKMAVRGMTVLVASGDDGVAGQRIHAQKMSINEGCSKSGPQWPSSSPYVTSVGATQLDTSGAEVVCSGSLKGGITSGGGFSNVYPTPSYQKDVVAAYLSSPNCPTKPGFFNTLGRGYPDIAVMGSHFSVIVNEKIHSVSGTSASTPVMAGLVTLWNDQRLKAGKAPLGFLNPLLYQIGSANPKAFHDITIGDNAAARNGSYECKYSFKAGVGWDAVTGFGTPDFNTLTKFVTDVKLDNFSSPSTQAPESSSGLPAYGIVLIILGSLVLIGIIVYFVRAYIHRKRSYKNLEMPQAHTPMYE